MSINHAAITPQPALPVGAFSITQWLHSSERVLAALLGVNVFLLLSSYYMLKTVREALILSQGGAEIKSYASALQALLLLAVIPAYGWFASKKNRTSLVSWVTLFFVSHLAVFFVLGNLGFHIGVAFFVWLGIFNVLVIAQFWAFANDILDVKRGEKLFPMIGIGSSLGAWVGSVLAAQFFQSFDAYTLMLMAGTGLMAAIVITILTNSSVQRNGQARTKADSDAEPIARGGAFRMIAQDRYLLLIALLIVVVNLVNTTGEFLLGRLVVVEAKAAIAAGTAGGASLSQVIGSFYGSFFSWVNMLGLVFQVFVVSRLFKYVGVRGALFVLPLIALGSYGMFAALPILAVVRGAKILENSADYSIQNTARHALFLPTSREAKYKAKTAIDSFFWRAGDVLQAGVVLVGTRLAFSDQHFAMLNIGFVLVWLAIVAAIYKRHRQLVPPEGMTQGV